MNIDFELYRVFYTVATIGNITKASQELMISQPAVSKSIKKLEEQLGGVLFTRTKRGVVLTEEGREFYKYIKQAVEQINNAESKFSDLINLEIGTIRIGISTTLTRQFLLPYLERFHKEYPRINIQILTNVSSELFNKLQMGLLDIVIVNLPYACNSEIEIKELQEVHDVFIVGNNYKKLVGKKMKLGELANYPLVLQAKGSISRSFLDKFLADNKVTLEPEMNLASFTLVCDFTKIGFGIGYSTKEYIHDALENEELYVLNVEPKIPSRKIGLAYSKKNLPSFCTRKLISIITDKLDK
ncbi:MAG: LysR family transcriptional regulator [Bacilli bacterium]|nr:LysR family transcriptional regulator [Bacilli bacterium]